MTNIRIPKIFHWLWFGSKPIPEQHQRWIEGWLALHPEWEHNIWTDINRPTFTNEVQFLTADNFSLKADVARYEIVYRYGGIYLDTDFECLRSLEPLLEDVEAFIASEEPDSLKKLGVGILGATPGHPWMAELIERLPRAMETGWGNQHQAGPVFARSVTVGRPDVTVFPEKLIQHEERTPLPETYAIHHGAGSWGDAGRAKFEAKVRQFVTEDIEQIIPAGSLFILVNKGRWIETNGRRSVPFPEHDGEWAGYPTDDAAAIDELERLRRAGAQFIVFPAPMFYWLDTYRMFRDYLYAKARPVISNERALIFDLRPAAPEKIDHAHR
jgi:mannosyltransferase OCH1-like enzyme